MAYRQESEKIAKRKARKVITSESLEIPKEESLREKALSALETVKQIEAERKDKLIAVKIDNKTTIYATPERAEYIKSQLNKAPILRGGAKAKNMKI